jgi:hypothetical protein
VYFDWKFFNALCSQQKELEFSTISNSFILIANTIFRATGHTKFVTKLCSLTMSGSLNTLKLDAPTLFTLFCNRNNNAKALNIFDFNNTLISSKEIATQNKDAVFSSFFDLQKIQQTYLQYGLKFAHNISLLPGLKAVRLLGASIKNNNNDKSNNSKDLPSSIVSTSAVKKNKSSISTNKSSSTTTTNTIEKDKVVTKKKLLSAEISALVLELKTILREKKKNLH